MATANVTSNTQATIDMLFAGKQAEIANTANEIVQKLKERVAAELQSKIEAGLKAEGLDTSLMGLIGVGPAPKKRGVKAGSKVEPKPCPNCGTPNTARRFSFLCEGVGCRTKKNLDKFASAKTKEARKAEKAAAAAGVTA
jgi:hypothetical protein